jgi:hypothetical protein
VELKAEPTLPGLVDEVTHLRGHDAVARAAAENDPVVVGELQRLGHRRSLIELVVRTLRDLPGHELGDALEHDLAALDLTRARDDRLGHAFDVPVARVVEH